MRISSLALVFIVAISIIAVYTYFTGPPGNSMTFRSVWQFGFNELPNGPTLYVLRNTEEWLTHFRSAIGTDAIGQDGMPFLNNQKGNMQASGIPTEIQEGEIFVWADAGWKPNACYEINVEDVRVRSDADTINIIARQRGPGFRELCILAIRRPSHVIALNLSKDFCGRPITFNLYDQSARIASISSWVC